MLISFFLGARWAPTVHIVRPGETLISIAERFDTTVVAIIDANPQLIRVGQRLIIPTPSAITEVDVPLIALGDGNIGCGDAVQTVTLNVPPTSDPLHATYEELLAIDEPFFAQTGLYDALFRSDLDVGSIAVSGGLATVRLDGDFWIGGVCDGFRAEAQLRRAALQFPQVNSVDVLINGMPLERFARGAP